ncbi:MAG TPA: hypothetical protein VGE26_12215 [Sphingobacteriaceae bacterium]
MKITEHESAEDRNNIRLLRIVLGAGSSTLLLTFIFLTTGRADTQELRGMIMPYLCVPVAGALAGLIFDMMEPMRRSGGFNQLLSIISSVLIYVVLFAGAFIVGMNGGH